MRHIRPFRGDHRPVSLSISRRLKLRPLMKLMTVDLDEAGRKKMAQFLHRL